MEGRPIAKEKGPYVNERGVSLFDLTLDLYDRWLMHLPYLRSGPGGTVAGDSQRELVRKVWPTVQQLCIRLEADSKDHLASRVERAFRDAEDYARIIDNYCESEQFDYHLWAYGDPVLDTIPTVDAEPDALLTQAEEIGECELTEDLYFTAFQREWAAELGKRSAEIEIEKYGRSPTDDYAERAEMRAWACFWLAAQLRRRGLSSQEAGGYLEQYLSSYLVVSETKHPIIHEALGRGYGMRIYPIAPLESEEVSAALEGFVSVVMQTRDALGLRPQAAAVSGESKEVPWNPDDKDYIPAKDAISRVREIDFGFHYGKLNKVLRPDGPMRYMRNPNEQDKGRGSIQCKVHKDDLETWCDGLRRAPTARGRQGEDNTSKPADTRAGLYHTAFAEGRAEGYSQGYTEVKLGKAYCCEPPFEDDPDDKYVHGQYEGWKEGYAEGRLDSENGEPQKYGGRE